MFYFASVIAFYYYPYLIWWY